jgi:hypothetical protein
MWGLRTPIQFLGARFVVAIVAGLSPPFLRPAVAQTGTTICQLPEFRGTAIYNRYCVGNSSPVLTAPVPVYDPARSFKLLAVNATGEFRVIKKNGRALTAADMSAIPIEYGDTMLTGPTGAVQFVLPDETVFTLGPNSEMEFDEFLVDPNMSISNMHVGFTKGLMRLVTGKIPHSDPQVRVAVGSLGIRGTDVEAQQSPDGTGSIKLHAGQAELTPYDTDKVIEIQAGQTIASRASGTIAKTIRACCCGVRRPVQALAAVGGCVRPSTRSNSGRNEDQTCSRLFSHLGSKRFM